MSLSSEYTIDATEKGLGRLSSEIASLLIGKNNPAYQPYVVQKNTVIVKNVAKMKMTEKKLDASLRYHHSGYPGGIKAMTLRTRMEKNPAQTLRETVAYMLPKNKLRSERLKQLIIE